MNTWITPEEARLAIGRGRGKGVRIALLDSGVEVGHPALGGLELSDDIVIVPDDAKLRVVPGEGRDLYGHGTAVAAILHRVAPEAEIGSIRVLGESLSARTAIILEGARQAIERGYHILNCSLGCGIPEHVLKYKYWVDEAYTKGVHVVAACNNHDSGRPEWPGFFSSVLTVNMARVAADREVYYRPGSLVEFAARGVDVEVAWRNGGMKTVSGSSFAAPQVAAMLACLLGEAPGISPVQAKALFQRVAHGWTDSIMPPNQR